MLAKNMILNKNDLHDENLTEIELYADYHFPDNQCFGKPCKYLGNQI